MWRLARTFQKYEATSFIVNIIGIQITIRCLPWNSTWNSTCLSFFIKGGVELTTGKGTKILKFNSILEVCYTYMCESWKNKVFSYNSHCQTATYFHTKYFHDSPCFIHAANTICLRNISNSSMEVEKKYLSASCLPDNH